MKIKRYQEAVIGGVILPGKERDEFRGLLLGTREGDRLRYADQTDLGLYGEKLSDLLSRLVPPEKPMRVWG